jgi:hypothetical protein
MCAMIEVQVSWSRISFQHAAGEAHQLNDTTAKQQTRQSGKLLYMSDSMPLRRVHQRSLGAGSSLLELRIFRRSRRVLQQLAHRIQQPSVVQTTHAILQLSVSGR